MNTREREEFTVRRAEARDVPQVVALELAAFTDPWSARSFSALLHRDEVFFHVVVPDDATSGIVGFSVTYLMGDEADLANIAVSESVRRRGVGRLLLGHLVRGAREIGVREIFLEVRESNLAARAMYKSEEFSEVGRRARYYVRPVEDALVLKRSLW